MQVYHDRIKVGMKNKLSVVIITKNAESTLNQCLESVSGWVNEIIISDDYSVDQTVEIATEYNAQIYFHHEKDLGKRKMYALTKAKGPWILVLDSDEAVSVSLKKEIQKILLSSKIKHLAYKIPFQNHFLGKPVQYGGENYCMLRFFRKDAVIIQPALVHESFITAGHTVGLLHNKIIHYSYRSVVQVFNKFTGYAWREACQKARNGEGVTLKKLTLYPIHMFWARFFKDSGYKDGVFRILLDGAFAYMELMTYIFLLFIPKHKIVKTEKAIH